MPHSVAAGFAGTLLGQPERLHRWSLDPWEWPVKRGLGAVVRWVTTPTPAMVGLQFSVPGLNPDEERT